MLDGLASFGERVVVFQYFLNPWMLLGLLGLSLPVLAHLLSKKRYDVVRWGAMQFLELSPNAKRKLRLEQLLLLLMRMGLIALIAFALARPWASGALFSRLAPANNRDLILIIDGSYSMGWEGGRITPHQAAVRKAAQILEELNAGDTVGLIDARDQVRAVIETPSRDFGFVREELDKLPTPSGSSNLPAAINRAMNILSATTNPSREIIVLTDGQALGWKADDQNLWARIEDLRKQVPFPPRLWIWDVTKTEGADNIPASSRVNFSVDRLSLSRELTVPDFPIRLKTKVQYHANLSPDAPGDPPQEVTRKVYLEVDGQRLREKQQTVLLKPDGEASVEFEYRFSSPGSHVLSVVLDEDNLPGDNRAEAAITVTKAIPVLLVDGNPSLDKTKTETFFLQAALSPSLLENPLVQATVIPWADFQPGQLDNQDVVILADVPQLTGQQVLALKTFVAKGGGLLIAVGEGAKAVAYNQDLYEEGLLPAKLDQIQTPPAGQQSVSVADASLELPWLMPFRRSKDGQFYTVRFEKWWRLTPGPEGEETEDGVELSTPIVAAQLEGDDPLLVTRKYGQGNVMLFATPMDAASQWNTLGVRQHTFVPLIYEMVFHLATPGVSHNVETGMPLIVEVPADLKFEDYLFESPDDSELPAKRQTTEEDRVFARLNETELPGVYTFRNKTQPTPPGGLPNEQFVANFDRAESDLTPLTEEQQTLLTEDNQTAFITSVDNLMENLVDDSQRAELFRYLMVLFLIILVFEIVMTRRLVQGGHMDLPTEGETEKSEDAEELQPAIR